MLRTLKMKTLTFYRAGDNSYVDASGKLIKSDEAPTEIVVRGSLQPISPRERETLVSKDGVHLSAAFYLYTRTKDIKTISSGATEADWVEVEGVEYVAWANAPWEGLKATTHNVVTLLKRDEVALDA